MTTTDPADLTVGRLAAEVRVVRIGTRDLTRAVYDQLEWAHPDAIEPLARVDVPHPEVADGWRPEVPLYVVGRRIGDGALVRSASLGDVRHIVIPDDDVDRYERWAYLPLVVLP